MRFNILALFGLLFGISVAATAGTKSSSDTILSMRSIGPVVLGMTVKEASVAGGTPLKAGDTTLGMKYKTYVTRDAYFWVGATDGRIRMACAISNTISTVEGIKKGDSAKKLKQLSRTKLTHMRNPLHYQLQPTNPQDRGYVIWFEVQGDNIEEICTGSSVLHSYVMEGGT